MDCSTPGFPVHHQLLELAQTHVHLVGDVVQPSLHPVHLRKTRRFHTQLDKVRDPLNDSRGKQSSITQTRRGLTLLSQPCRVLRGSQAPRRAVCGTRGSLRTMHGGGSAPSCCAFTHRVRYQAVSTKAVPVASLPKLDVPPSGEADNRSGSSPTKRIL